MNLAESSFDFRDVSYLISQLQRSRRSIYAVISLISFCLLAHNGATVFLTRVPVSTKNPVVIPVDNVAGESRKASFSVPKLSSSVLFLLKEEEISRAKLSTRLLVQQQNRTSEIHPNWTTVDQLKRRANHWRGESKRFEVRVREFFNSSASDSPCKFQFFMTWISELASFGSREMFALNSLFKSHPNACLIIASDSFDSFDGMQILQPLVDNGLKVTAIAPDFDYLFRNTPAAAWYDQLLHGNVNPGEVPFGQNLSNLLRLGLLYRFGGIYIDTDVVVLRSFGVLKNAIGAQTMDVITGNWSRLNNAVMVFDEGHPLLYKFIQEFALTYDGNKWGHNGPYLVSRVVSRVSGRPEYNFTVLPPMAFYPVDWSRIGSLFEGPRSLSHSKWLFAKLNQIHTRCFAVHLWNKQSRGLVIERGSVIHHIMLSIDTIHNSSLDETSAL